jgi:hypothetical protein
LGQQGSYGLLSGAILFILPAPSSAEFYDLEASAREIRLRLPPSVSARCRPPPRQVGGHGGPSDPDEQAEELKGAVGRSSRGRRSR